MKITLSVQINALDQEILAILKRSPYPLTVEQIKNQLARKNIIKSSNELARELNTLALYFIIEKTKGRRVCEYSMPEDPGHQ